MVTDVQEKEAKAETQSKAEASKDSPLLDQECRDGTLSIGAGEKRGMHSEVQWRAAHKRGMRRKGSQPLPTPGPQKFISRCGGPSSLRGKIY